MIGGNALIQHSAGQTRTVSQHLAHHELDSISTTIDDMQAAEHGAV